MASIEPNKTTKLNELKINLVDTKATFQAMQQAEIVESNQLYFIEENDDYILPIASDNALGGIKTGYPSSGKTYGVTVNSNGQAYVTVDWENTQTITGVKGGAETNYRTGDVNITKANIGLGNVENTALSTWTGSNKITSIGTLSSGTVPWARLSGVPNGATKEGTVTSLTIKTTSPITGGNDTATTTTGSYTIALTDAYGDTKNPYGSKTKNYVLAAPSTTAGNPSFRALVSADIPNLNASKITAGQFSNARLANSKVTIAGNDVSLGGSLTADTLRESLGLSNAMHFIGVTTVEITDGSTTDPTISGSSYSTKTAGDVVLYDDAEFVWTGDNNNGHWELLGDANSFKVKQTVVTAPATETNKWISSIGQDANGVISAEYGSLDTSGTWSGNATKLGTETKGSASKPIYLNEGVPTATDFDISTYGGTNQHWGVRRTVGTTNTGFSGKNTSLVTEDNGLLMWNSTDNKSIWEFNINNNNIALRACYTPNDTSGTIGENKFTARLVYKDSNITTAVGSTSQPVYISAVGKATAITSVDVAHGGTGTDTLTSGEALIGNGTDAVTTRTITNNTTATVAATTDNLITNKTLYYATASINNARQTSDVSIYAPITAGTANQILVSAGGTLAPTWKATAKGAAYATSTNGELTFGTLPVAQGGTGKTTWTVNGLLYASAATTLASMVPAWENWGTGTTAGPTAKIQLGNKSYESSAIPSASASASGVVTTGAQTFAGAKTFNNKIILGGTESSTAAINFSRSGYNYITVPTGGSLAIGTDSSSASTWCKFTNGNILPERTEEISLGASDKKWANVYATKFNGEASNVTTTDSINSSTPLELIGVTSTATTDLKRKSLITMSTTTAGRAARIIFTDNAKVPINGDSNTTQTRKGWIGLNGDGTNFGVYSSTTGQTGYLVALTNDGTYQFGAGNISAKNGTVNILTSIISPTYITTSVSYGEESNRPSNPVEGQLYFQFID